MKLRARIALATLAVTAPMIGYLVWLDVHAQQLAAELELRDMVLVRTALPGERERCEAAPQGWQHGPRLGPEHEPPPGMPPEPGSLRGPPPSAATGVRGPHRAPAEFFAYDAQLHSPLTAAPQLMASAVPLPGEQMRSRSVPYQPDRVEVLVRTPWPTGACAYVLARGTTEPWLGALLPPTRIWALPALMVFAAVLIAIGPVVRRIRLLTQAVRQSAAIDYAEPVALRGHDEIAELSSAFAAAAAEVRAQLAAKDRRDQVLRAFLADTSHDVAIPLTVLQGHLVTLQERGSSGQALDLAALRSAMDEAHYIGALLHNLAAAAKLEASDVPLQHSRVDLNALASRVVSRHRPLAQQRGVAIDVALPEPTLYADADVTLLEQAVSNVVYNAVRHNAAGGHVALLLEPGPRAEFRIRVLDDGPGVSAEALEKLRERGYRGTQARTRSTEGQGLGLHITQRVLDAHAMRLSLSVPEAGGLQVDIEGARSNGSAPV